MSAIATRRRTRTTLAGLVGVASIRYLMLTSVAVVSSVPLIWMISTSLKESGNEFLFPPQWVPDPAVWANYVDVWSRITNLLLFVSNTFIVSVLATVGTVLSCSLVAYGFGRMSFPGRSTLFGLLLATMMLPAIITLVPTFILFRSLGLTNSLLPLILPFWFGGGAFGSAFYVFLIRQFLMQLPRDLDEAAVMDGASHWRIYWSIIMPLARPSLAATAIFSFIHHWNDFLNPLIFIDTERWRTLALALRYLINQFTFCCARTPTPWNILMAAAVVMLVPILILFFSAQRYFIRGIALTGLGGR